MQAADCTALPPWELTTSELEREISTPAELFRTIPLPAPRALDRPEAGRWKTGTKRMIRIDREDHAGGDHALEFWLWEASATGECRGITDAEARARNAAEACLRSGQASTVRVEQACLVMNGSMDSEYQRTGVGWSAWLSNGKVTWRSLAPGKSAA